MRRSQGARWQMKSLNLWSVQLVQAGGDWAGGLGPYSLRTLPRIVQPLTRWEKTPHRLNAELLLLTEAARRSACQNFSSLADMQTPRAALPLTWGSAEAQSRTADWLETPPGDHPVPLFSPSHCGRWVPYLFCAGWSCSYRWGRYKAPVRTICR